VDSIHIGYSQIDRQI